MRLGELQRRLDPPPAWPEAAAGLEIAGISADSRRIRPGMIFAALPGHRADGRAFIAEAVARGAVAVLSAPETAWPDQAARCPLLADAAPRRRLAQLAALLAGPQPRIVAAVTGTNGKTSTVDFLRQLWTGAGHHAASLGTLGVQAEGFPPGPGLTTPDPERLAALLAELAGAGVDRVALEASSHGLDQCRLDGVRLAAAGFTNLTRDHLDYHGTEAAYRAAKLRLLGELLPPGSPAVVNADMDGVTLSALRAVAARHRLDLYTVGEAGTWLRLRHARPLPDGQELEIQAGGVRRVLRLPLVGRFQADNALMAAALAEVLGDAAALDRLGALHGVRGRMERVAVLGNGAAVYVDYAHTPDALERLLGALRPHTPGRLRVVFGAGGDRDPGKRPMMGAVAARLADAMIVTDDNPRTEAPAAIRAAILVACPGATEIGDRARAIEAGIDALSPGDVLAIAGKGHEQGQTIGTTTVPFDDASVVRGLLAQGEVAA